MAMPDVVRTWWQESRRQLKSRMARLTLSYLAVIMVMSLGFSIVLYNTSTYELRRQIPPPELIDPDFSPFGNSRTQQFFERRYEEGRLEIITHLAITNLGVLLMGALVSYYLAGRTLRPIERALEAQSRFASDASHELRTPLTVIQTENEVALRRNNLTLAEAKATLRSNVEEVTRLRQLAEGLLRLAREDPADLQLEPVSVQDVASEAMNHVIKQAQARHITIHDETPRLKVLADEQSLVQAIVILLENAIKYSHEGGTVFLTASRRGAVVSLKVRDEGVGIPAKHQPYIFDRFYRVDASRTNQAGTATGYGLGLALARQIVHQQQGTITVNSTPNKGATFMIKLTHAT